MPLGVVKGKRVSFSSEKTDPSVDGQRLTVDCGVGRIVAPTGGSYAGFPSLVAYLLLASFSLTVLAFLLYLPRSAWS